MAIREIREGREFLGVCVSPNTPLCPHNFGSTGAALRQSLISFWMSRGDAGGRVQGALMSLSLDLGDTAKVGGEGNGNPLQYSCLEKPVDKGAWWTAVHGVTQSRTRLKRLSSSSSSEGGTFPPRDHCRRRSGGTDVWDPGP